MPSSIPARAVQLGQVDLAVDSTQTAMQRYACAREKPYLDQNPLNVLYLLAMNGTPTTANPENLSPTFCDSLSKALEFDADAWPDAMQLLQHSFFAISGPLCMLSSLIKAAREIARNRSGTQFRHALWSLTTWLGHHSISVVSLSVVTSVALSRSPTVYLLQPRNPVVANLRHHGSAKSAPIPIAANQISPHFVTLSTNPSRTLNS
jgi:hypothetical protein